MEAHSRGRDKAVQSNKVNLGFHLMRRLKMNSLRTLPLSQAFKKATLTIILGSLATSGFASESDTKINQSVSIDDIFSNSMVLQRSAPIKFRGTAKSGEPFSLEFASENKTVQPNADGRWSASFTALPDRAVNVSA